MRYKKIIHDYLSYNRNQRLAIYAMIVISVIALSLPNIASRFQSENTISPSKLDSIKIILAQAGNVKDALEEEDQYNGHPENELFYFNPNTATKSEWVQLGIQEDISGRIINYISKGGKFYKKTDLLKIYAFKEDDFERLYAYIVLEKNDNETKRVAAESDSLFYFDPNTITKEQWMQLGIKNFIADRIINYISKGGKYDNKEDLLKIYGFEQRDFERLKDYISIDSVQFEIADTEKENTGVKEKQIVEINIATKEQLTALGFSTYNANGILKFRDDVGGVYAIKQLYDVYKIDTVVLNNSTLYLQADISKIQKININTASLEQLGKHTYISEQLANAIVVYRTHTGRFTSVSEIQKVDGMHPKLYEKLKPYLTI